MEQLRELLQQILELAGAGVEALDEVIAASGGGGDMAEGGTPPEGGGAPEEEAPVAPGE